MRAAWGARKREWIGCLLEDLRDFGINADQWTTAAQDEGEWRKTAEQGAERFKAKWIATKKVGAGLRHAVVCPNVTGRTKERIAQSKRAHAGLFALVNWRELVSSGHFLFCCRCYIPFSGVTFASFRCRIFA